MESQLIRDPQIHRDYGTMREEQGMSSSVKRMLINEGQDDEMEIAGYKTDKLKAFITYIFFILTCGFLRLLFHWIPHWHVYATSRICSVTDAQVILITEVFKGKHKMYYVKPLKILRSDNVVNMGNIEGKSTTVDPQLIEDLTQTQPTLSIHYGNGTFREMDKLIMFTCKKVTYIWIPETSKFEKLRGLDAGVSSHKFHENKGLSNAEAFMRRVVYGLNMILIQESSIAKLLFLEVLNPFYIFQIASIILWFLDNYYYYACAIILISTFGICMTVIQTKKNERNLRATVHSSDVCKVLRRNYKMNATEQDAPYTEETISTELLVPGDILEIPAHGCVMHCDALLLTGNCILNESMLTGESVPVTKTALPNIKDVIYDPKEHAKHTLFCGTHVIQTRYFGNEKVLAVVVSTGFSTAKGNLVKSILYPPPVDFKFEKDSYKFVGFMACIATVGFIYTVITKIMRNVPVLDLVFEALDLITIVIPPALPAAMTVGCFYAQIRLEKSQIFCISPRSINVSGSLNCVCFDKTGTLTEDGLDLLCVVPAEGKKFGNPITEVDAMPYSSLFFGLVSCHSLTIIDKNIVGDPLDLKMFESTKWLMEEPEVADNNKFDLIFPTVMKPPNNRGSSENLGDQLQIGIIREFPFSSSLQRMGVVIRKLNAPNFEYYCKGSPEMLLNFIDEKSLPSTFHEILENYTQDGCRVIAIAHTKVKMSYAKIQKVQRDVLEKDLTFLGLIVLENRLKPETTPCIEVLNDANIRIVMVTGDNILTAVSVARDCCIIKPGESVITVNCDNSNPPSLYYTLNNFKPKIQQNNVGVISNSASVMSLDTVESQIQNSETFTNMLSQRKDSVFNNYRFAMTGRVWRVIREHYSDELLWKLVTRGTIFARMAPEQKQQLVQELQALGYYVAMCGDGANDCGALKAANTGVSLSEAESSVASPFTSKNANISCVIQVIKEGRAALVTSFGIFKYMAAYSICQFMSVLILYNFESNLTDMEFLYIDLCIISVFAFFFGKTASYSGKLVKEPPLTSLISLSPILSLILQLILILAFQLGSFWYLNIQPWYTPFHHTGDDRDDVACKENFTIFTITSFQYITLAIVFSKGKPYRKTIFSNTGLLLTCIILVSFSTYITLFPTKYVADFFALDVPDDFSFRLTLVILASIYFVICFLIEFVIIDFIVFKRCSQQMDKSAKYMHIDKDLDNDTKWPPLTSTADFSSTATPDNTMPTCTAEIVVEKENKFDKNHVLNKLYNGSDNGQSTVENKQFDDLQLNSVYDDIVVPNSDLNKVSFKSTKTTKNSEERKLNLKTISDVNLNKKMEFITSNKSKINMSDTNLCSTPNRFSNLKNFECNLGKNATISEDLFTSVQSNFNNLSSGSDTFKSFSPSDTSPDIFGSNCNISELPYDEDENMKLTSNSSDLTSDLSSIIDEKSRNESIQIDNFYNHR